MPMPMPSARAVCGDGWGMMGGETKGVGIRLSRVFATGRPSFSMPILTAASAPASLGRLLEVAPRTLVCHSIPCEGFLAAVKPLKLLREGLVQMNSCRIPPQRPGGRQ